MRWRSSAGKYRSLSPSLRTVRPKPLRPQPPAFLLSLCSRARRRSYPWNLSGSPAGELALGLEPYRTAWDAIGDLPARPNDPAVALCGKWADLLPTIPEGENYLWHTNRGGGEPLFGWRTRFWSFLLKLKKDQPSWTIQAQPGPATGPFHWCNRRLTAHELCRLQTFPDGLVFECGHNAVQRLVGNAVPSLLAEVLARAIRAQLLDSPCRYSIPRLMPPVRGRVPRAEAVKPLPRRYRALVGKHADHPGEGLGARARQRIERELAYAET
jgi:DNA (cytosine-5)-methyltransferase 1